MFNLVTLDTKANLETSEMAKDILSVQWKKENTLREAYKIGSVCSSYYMKLCFAEEASPTADGITENAGSHFNSVTLHHAFI